MSPPPNGRTGPGWHQNPFVIPNSTTGKATEEDILMLSAATPPVMPLAPRDSGPAPKLPPSEKAKEAKRIAKCHQCDASGLAWDLSGQEIRCTHGREISASGAADHA